MTNEDWDQASQLQRFSPPRYEGISDAVEIRDAFCDLAEVLMERMPKNREAFVAMNNLETACMYAVRAVEA
ncbi:hypothetical protein SEA_KABOCHA_14 [Gordonia phage Kabocha]|uniref:Acb2/Tad1 hairpin domain-containing protein n=1 Tax=Gordonia phage Chidiebere TaxID=2656530 RepID=A0A649VKI4_9CAUD|nr:hypothetical protein PQD14_gp014 [Gordonia phage Chidiebere]AZS07869.1 hypothetical protein PBI_GRAY_14 [Gordonia phage Gray]WAA19801.1 hypothetical protein SEA_KABOCHA_14 [Gordonia phage Kabocha]WAA19992.1 hypothetical protein SEA_HANEM_14 [Gordonia phage Hanem]WNM67035.1 hypothetical protein SEA_SCHOMBER_14 [Gordonia Phage Schomber]QGJ92906.1 hypothetical protein PBI_CHIDIEBERE_14 [Gordonia phage Chidiebere]